MKNVCVNFIPCYCWFCMHTFALIHISLFVCAYILNISVGSTLHRGLVEIIRVQIMLRTDFERNGHHWNWAVCYGREESIRCKNSSRAYLKTLRGHIWTKKHHGILSLGKLFRSSNILVYCVLLWTTYNSEVQNLYHFIPFAAKIENLELC